MTKVNFPANEKANVTRPCLIAACRGNENIADLLNYLVYEAEAIAEKLKVEGNDITLQLSHDKMLNRPKNAGKRFNFSEKSLIGYLRKLDEWKLITTGKYGRSLVVHIANINALITNPPEQPQRKKTGGRKSCKVETFKGTSTLEKMLNLSNEKVGNLQQNVELLQLKVGNLQLIVGKLQLLISSNPALQAALGPEMSALDSVDTIYSIDFFTGATYRSDDDDFTGPSPDKKNSYSQEEKQPTEENAVIAEQAQQIAELRRQLAEAQADSSRLQEKHNNQSSRTSLFQDTVPAESAAPKVVLPDMTKDVLQRDTRQPTPAEQKRIDANAEREMERQAKKREAELWDVFDKLFGFPVDRFGYNKPRIPALARNPLATDEIIKIGFDAVLNDPRTKSNPARLTITTIADELPAHIRAHRIKAVQSSKPKEETALEKIYRERREVAARLQSTQKEIAQ